MKTTALRTGAAIGLSVLLATGAFRALADQQLEAAKDEKSYTGTIKSVDPKEHMLNVKGPLFSKSFNLGANCAYTLLGQGNGTAEGLRPGQKVKVSYHNASGVLVVNRVEQQPMRFEGKVKSIDRQARTLTLQMRAMDRTLPIADNCEVVLRGERSGSLDDVQPGHQVTVLYETPDGNTLIRQIEQTSIAYVGTLTAIDVNERTIKAKGALGSKKFNLAAGCTILVNGKNVEMRVLKPGDRLTFNFDDVNGVNVATRIVQSSEPPETFTARASN